MAVANRTLKRGAGEPRRPKITRRTRDPGPNTTPSIKALERSRLYSEELDIDLRLKSEGECFKWFLASLLFGSHISETIAKNTYHQLVLHKLLSPHRIIEAGWDFLVDPIMRQGGYSRYDGRKSTQLIRNSQKLVAEYRGSLLYLHAQAADARALEALLMDFSGIGPVTVNIFLRELRPHWAKADPEPLSIVLKGARELGVHLDAYARKSTRFARVEAGLIRMRRHIAR